MSEENFTDAKNDIARIGSLVLTSTGKFEHVYRGNGLTLCGHEVDEARATEDGSFWPCLACDKIRKNGGVRAAAVLASRALRARTGKGGIAR